MPIEIIIQAESVDAVLDECKKHTATPFEGIMLLISAIKAIDRQCRAIDGDGLPLKDIVTTLLDNCEPYIGSVQ